MNTSPRDIDGYIYDDADPDHAHSYLLPDILERLESVEFPTEKRRVFDLGCGNGSMAARLEAEGYTVTGIDPSKEGIRRAKEHYPGLDLHQGSGYDDLSARFGRFPVVMSLEVIEHVYDPRTVAETMYELATEEGTALVSTPYHGFWKNVMIALTGSYDDHHNPLWDHGHIKFWSMDTLRVLLEEAGFIDIKFDRVGRIPPLAKSMIAVARKPKEQEPASA